MEKAKRKRNTTPCLSVKTPTSQSTSGEMVVVGEGTTGARVEDGKQRGNVARRNDQGRRNRGVRLDNDGSHVWSGDDDWDVVMRCVWEMN